ncbi:NADPH-dependent 7-cyano-7-deazaguanine reductase QueF [Alteromonas pelagimontana]|uniref:NADPH-dependent 7-cyano-7-deazaguanine reductase n=1 Tax=Alteromonas pelagimontana TaxID=1858656 RepID=A0A6M4MF07_9ALTE|nr:NADPH-dependent 7-cyano-7-deazaguanine reductase QueF [Alteromonas pelagimontana]QJR81761.1 NADPH-dependent 7-cyano-7-deazaguanine reductase QueF [Alteromonas pelagimontana]
MNSSTTFTLPTHLTLGKTVEYETVYNPALLQSVPRSLGRDAIGLDEDAIPFSGSDVWTGYELSWLNAKGKPQVAMLECSVPVTSPNLIESKSFKLYLNSFNQTRFSSVESVQQTLTKDLSGCAGEQVYAAVVLPEKFTGLKIQEFSGKVIDDLDIEVTNYTPENQSLWCEDDSAAETLISHLLKSNCLITSQPDWASILIKYEGQKINEESLLRYLIGFRQHNEFHEQCVERIFCDILARCQPKKLTVYARYTRRGGLDINPFRSNFELPYPNHRLARQ